MPSCASSSFSGNVRPDCLRYYKVPQEVVEACFTIVGLASPPVSVFGAVKQGQQDGALGDPVDETIQEFLFRIEFLSHRRVVCHVCKEDGDQLALAFNGTAGGQDLVCQVFGGAGLGLAEVDGGGFGSGA
jgi:hypothetical protein